VRPTAAGQPPASPVTAAPWPNPGRGGASGADLRCRRSSRLAFLAVFALSAAGAASRESDWLPITQEDLALTAEPKAPRAPAIYLYRQVDRDDNAHNERTYLRIKILTEEGRNRANVIIRFNRNGESVRELEARTIHPDGTIVNFDGRYTDEPIMDARAAHLMGRAFTLPDVEVGSIIEYRYLHQMSSGFVLNSTWTLSADLYTRLARFSIEPYSRFSVRWTAPVGLPPGLSLPNPKRGRVEMEVRDLPEFVNEEHMPPVAELRYRVDFMYSGQRQAETDPTAFWKRYGMAQWQATERFVDQPRAMRKVVEDVTQKDDAPEVALRKLYSAAQHIRNLTFERARTEEEKDRDNPKRRFDVEDVWNRGYADAYQINWLFLALARAAGLQADALFVAGRYRQFFNAGRMNPGEIDSTAVLVQLDGQSRFFNAGNPFQPFATLEWDQTGVRALQLAKDGGTWIPTPSMKSAGARVERKAELKLSPDNVLRGRLTVTYIGQEALNRRTTQRGQDALGRKEYLEKQARSFAATGMDVKLVNEPNWSDPEQPLVAEFDVELPGYVSVTARRGLMQVGVFSESERHSFERAIRLHPVYFEYPYSHDDDISIALPDSWQVASLPAPVERDRTAFAFAEKATSDGATSHITRHLSIDTLYLAETQYDLLRDFFQAVRASDEGQIVLGPKGERPAR
jgi:hypothetical protein